jgi:hypothetical protein
MKNAHKSMVAVLDWYECLLVLYVRQGTFVSGFYIISHCAKDIVPI